MIYILVLVTSIVIYQQSVSESVDEMSMVDLDTSSFPHDQLGPHRVVVSCLVVLVGVKVGVVASLDPHMEASVVSPATSHQVLGCQVLLSFSFVHVEHEEEKFFGHLGDHR